MTLDRRCVDRCAGLHLRHLREAGVQITPRKEQEVRRLHERLAAKVERTRRPK